MRIADLAEFSGQGIAGHCNGMRVALEPPEDGGAGLATRLRIGDSATTLTFTDPLRPDAGDTLAELCTAGIEARIVSGDRAGPVAAVADTLGLAANAVTAEASPQDKLALLETLRAAGQRPLMVGDGLNDGPALAAAHASIAPGTASDASQQAADAVFLGERLMPVALAVPSSYAAAACAPWVSRPE